VCDLDAARERRGGPTGRRGRDSSPTCASCDRKVAKNALEDRAIAADGVPFRLTTRQLEVLALLCQGLPNKTISRRLAIAEATVKVHVGAIMRAMRVGNRLQAVLAARPLGFWCDPHAAVSRAEKVAHRSHSIAPGLRVMRL
jgi:ATP/maltotriose-dependent transcriptional regulator MalT